VAGSSQRLAFGCLQKGRRLSSTSRQASITTGKPGGSLRGCIERSVLTHRVPPQVLTSPCAGIFIGTGIRFSETRKPRCPHAGIQICSS
jgi:hypothetical protein